jgi:hypothetical protein
MGGVRLGDWVVQVRDQRAPPAYRRSGFEVVSWDGTRWTLEGIYDTGLEATQEARHLLQLGKRLGIKVTQEIFAEEEGVFKSRIVLTEYRDGVAGLLQPRKEEAAPAYRDGAARLSQRKEEAELAARPRPRRVVIQAASNDNSMMVSITALAISVASLLLAMMR